MWSSRLSVGEEGHGQSFVALTSERLPWSQLTAPSVLPPFDAEHTGGVRREEPCRECDRDGYFDTARAPLELYYDISSEELGRVPDFSSTWEHFGRSRLAEPFRDSVFAQPRLVVKPSVLHVFKRLKLGDLRFDPVNVLFTPRSSRR